MSILVSHCPRQLYTAGRIKELHRHPFNTGLTRTLLAIAILIQIDRVADQARRLALARRRVPEVLRQVRARQIGHRTDAVARDEARGRVDGVRIHRRRQATQHVGRVVDPHQIVVRTHAVGRRQAREEVSTTGVRGRRGDDSVPGIKHLVAIDVPDQRHRYTGDAVIAAILEAIRIRVEVHPIPNAGEVARRVVTEVRVDVHVTRRQHHGGRGLVVQRRIRIPGLSVACGVGATVDHHRVNTGRESVEDVTAVHRRSRRRLHRVNHTVAIGIPIQGHRNAAQSGFTRILHAVAVGIHPEPVANGARARVVAHVWRGRPIVAEVRGHKLLTRRHRHSGRMGGHDAVEVIRRVGCETGCQGARARGCHLHHVAARG